MDLISEHALSLQATFLASSNSTNIVLKYNKIPMCVYSSGFVSGILSILKFLSRGDYILLQIVFHTSQ